MGLPDGFDTVTRYNATVRAFHAGIAVQAIADLAVGLLFILKDGVPRRIW